MNEILNKHSMSGIKSYVMIPLKASYLFLNSLSFSVRGSIILFKKSDDSIPIMLEYLYRFCHILYIYFIFIFFLMFYLNILLIFLKGDVIFQLVEFNKSSFSFFNFLFFFLSFLFCF